MPALASTFSSKDSTSLSGLERTRVKTAWLFLTPILLALSLVAIWPLLRTVLFSFTDANFTDL